MPSKEGCMTKEAGGVSYNLVEKMETKMLKCNDNCVLSEDWEANFLILLTGELVAECTE